jgi:hypothetical protein
MNIPNRSYCHCSSGVFETVFLTTSSFITKAHDESKKSKEIRIKTDLVGFIIIELLWDYVTNLYRLMKQT